MSMLDDYKKIDEYLARYAQHLYDYDHDPSMYDGVNKDYYTYTGWKPRPNGILFTWTDNWRGGPDTESKLVPLEEVFAEDAFERVLQRDREFTQNECEKEELRKAEEAAEEERDRLAQEEYDRQEFARLKGKFEGAVT